MYYDNYPRERPLWGYGVKMHEATREDLPWVKGLYAGLVSLVDTWFGYLIDVSHNKLTSLPPEVGNLTDTSLRATNNRITKLPDEIVHVKSVDLSGNPIPAAEQERIRRMLSPARSRAVKF